MNEAFSRVIIDAQLADQGWNTQLKVGDKAPRAHFENIQNQCAGGPLRYGAITDVYALRANVAANCVPEAIMDMDVEQVDDFLKSRRELMAAKAQVYDKGL